MDPLRINSRLSLPANELHVSFSRAGGPGGQNVNKVATRVLLRFSVSGSRVLGNVRRGRLERRLGRRLTRSGDVLVRASRFREQARNLEDARARLASLVREALQVPRARKATSPSPSSRRRRLEAKRQRGDLKRSRRRLED